MLHLSIEQTKNWDVFKNKIPLNTYKFLQNEIQNHYKELMDLEKFLRENSQDIDKQTRFKYLELKIQERNKVLMDHHTIAIPPEQSQFCSMSTATLLNLNGRRKWVIPDVCVTSPNTINYTNPLCKEILGKEKFSKGVYINPNTKEETEYEILEILSYTETKQKFFRKVKEEKNIQQISVAS